MLSGSRHVASLARPDSLGIECEAEHSWGLCFDFVCKGGDPSRRACIVAYALWYLDSGFWVAGQVCSGRTVKTCLVCFIGFISPRTCLECHDCQILRGSVRTWYLITREPNELSNIYAKMYLCDGVCKASKCTETTRHMCEPCALEDPGNIGVALSLGRTGGSCVKEFKDLLYSMRAPGAPRQGRSARPGCVTQMLQHSLTACRCSILTVSGRVSDLKTRRCR
jgi:hypothetical protein